MLAALIAKGQMEGAYRQDRSAQEMADLLVNAWQGALLRMKIERSTGPLERCCQSLLGDSFRG
jgi:TetR/AcrR family transcriptional repressor of nem operon